MPFIRLSDNYIDHPKFRCLTDGSFRLWHRVMAYARTYQTDGMIGLKVMRGFKEYSPKRLRELVEPCEGETTALLDVIDGFGFKIHNYLKWNLSKDEEGDERAAARARMQRLRSARSGERSGEQVGERSPDVPDRIGSERNGEKGSWEKPPDARSKRPIYQSDRFAVFEWQLDDLSRMLGKHLNDFDLHAFFDDLSRRSREQGLVIPADREARWKWLQSQLEAEAKRRGLPMATAGAEADMWADIARKGPSVRPYERS